MKLPYRTGDSFELPLGTGVSVPATIAACDHHVVEIVVLDRRLRVYDDALVLHRWRGNPHDVGGGSEHTMCDRPKVGRTVVGPAHAERIVASWHGVAAFDEAPVTVYEMHDGIEREWLTTLPPWALLSWSRPLAPAALECLRTHIESGGKVRLRLHGPAAVQAEAFAGVAVGELTLAGPFSTQTRFNNVRELTLDTPLERLDLGAAFPNLHALHVTAGAKSIDFAALAAVPQLEMLDCSHVSVVAGHGLEPLARLRHLQSLRLARVDGLRSLCALERLPALHTLAVEHQHLDSLAPLPLCASLEQLELLGMWQYSIEDLAWVQALPRLLRAEIDIGGRRKNVELYRRARWAYPWPCFSGGGMRLTGPPE